MHGRWDKRKLLHVDACYIDSAVSEYMLLQVGEN